MNLPAIIEQFSGWQIAGAGTILWLLGVFVYLQLPSSGIFRYENLRRFIAGALSPLAIIILLLFSLKFYVLASIFLGMHISILWGSYVASLVFTIGAAPWSWSLLSSERWRQAENLNYAEWFPVVSLGIFAWLYLLLRYWNRSRIKYLLNENEMKSVSVVIPTFNSAEYLSACLESVRQLDPPPSDVIACDGGSEDSTLQLLKEYEIPVYHQKGGRGPQIRRGINQARGDVVMVVHSDAQLEKDAVAQVLQAFHKHDGLIGGALGCIFPQKGLRYRVVECINRLRSTFTGINFGDQVQFFRRDADLWMQLFPSQPLMEDVELSLRMAASGENLYLWGRTVVNRYELNGKYSARFKLVNRFLFGYLWQRFRHGQVDTKAMYQEYYRKTLK